jgi:hypothetical protein
LSIFQPVLSSTKLSIEFSDAILNKSAILYNYERNINTKFKFLGCFIHSQKFSREITAFIGGNCVLCCFNEFTKKINKIKNKTNVMAKICVFLSVLCVILSMFFVNSLLKQQSTQLPALKAVILHENF